MIKLISRFLSFISWKIESLALVLVNFELSNLFKKRINEKVFQETGLFYEWKSKDTNFGLELAQLISDHVDLFKDIKREDREVVCWLEDFIFDYNDLVNKHNGVIPVKNSSGHYPSEKLKESGRVINIEIMQSYSPNLKVDQIVEDLKQNILHLKESYKFDDTLFWVTIEQHKEAK